MLGFKGVEAAYLVLSVVSPFLKAKLEGANLAFANWMKCSVRSGSKKRGYRYVLQQVKFGSKEE